MPTHYDSSSSLISIHVPKTGGTTVKEALKIWFGEKFHEHYVNEALVEEPSRHDAKNPICVHGHFNRFRGFGVDDYYLNSNQFITFLRDPFEQHVSLFFYLRREADNYRFQGKVPAVAAYEKFEEFMSYLKDQRETIQKTFANTFLAHIPKRFENIPPNDIFDHHFIHMGIVEKMTSSLRLLAAKLNKPPSIISPQNISPRDLKVSPSLRDTHIKLFTREHEFYDVIKKRHYAELEEHAHITH